MMVCHFRAFASVFLMSLTLSVVHADVTLRYKMEVKANPALPAQMAARALPQESLLRLKGGKGFSSSMGFNSIVDFATKETTILDTATKRYAKLTYDQFAQEMARAMPDMPAQARAGMANLKPTFRPPG